MSSYWSKMTDEELVKRKWEEEKRRRYAREKVDKAIARANIEAIIKEQAIRHERKFGLE